MSNKRQADMADIANAIETGITKRRDESVFRANVADELKARGQTSDDETIDATVEDANTQIANDEKNASADQALELRRRSLLKAQALKAYRTSGMAINGVKNGVGRLYMPTGLWLPVLVLLTLFMLLVKVNGNTRAGWLWAVITGNAALPDSITSNGANGTITVTTNADGSLTGSGDFGQGTGTGSGGPPPMYVPFRPAEMDEW